MLTASTLDESTLLAAELTRQPTNPPTRQPAGPPGKMRQGFELKTPVQRLL